MENENVSMRMNLNVRANREPTADFHDFNFIERRKSENNSQCKHNLRQIAAA